MRPIKIVNGRVITPNGILTNATVQIAKGRITAVIENPAPDYLAPDYPAPDYPARDTPAPGTPESVDPGPVPGSSRMPGPEAGIPGSPDILDAAGCYIAPGFIDLHVHGGGGHDFMDGTEEAFLGVARLHARHGTTAMTPTTLSAGKQQLLATLETYERLAGKPTGGAQFIGMHLEGPYFAMNQRGAQDPRYIRNPDPEEYHELISRFPGIRRWSVAPELPGALEMAGLLKEKGILAAWAHTDALYDDIVTAFEHGYTHTTHLYSAMLGVTRRNATRFAGAVEAAFLIDEMTVEIIADGIHIPPPLLRLIGKLKDPTKTALITDAIRGAGMTAGECILGGKDDGLRVIIEDGVAKLPDRSAFAGSVATADRLVRTMIRQAGRSLEDTIRMITRTPADIMGVADRKGSIATGRDADIVLFDNDINIHYTIVGGEIVYSKNDYEHR
jgi:N-acetylglucosamine-6-phosphate deacetylase